jgi:glycosyltransferase involved in cell wall biosynthesis
LAVLGRLQAVNQTYLAVGQVEKGLPAGDLALAGPWQRVKGLDRSGLIQRGGLAARRRLSELIQSQKPDIIHVHNIMDPELLSLAAGAGPSVMTVQDHRVFCPGLGKLTPQGAICGQPMGEECLACFRDKDYGRRMLELTRRRLKALAGFDRLLVLSNYMADELTAAGMDRKRIQVLPPFVQGLPPNRPKGPGGYHLLAGRLVRRKGVRVALEAASLLQTPATLVIAGDGPLAGEISKAAQASGGGIRFVGWAHRKSMAGLLGEALSLWLPSLWAEPFGISGLEALHQGVPVIASAVGGVEDWLWDGENGHAVPAGDPAALAAAADRLATEPERAWEMGRQGATLVRERFAPKPLMQSLSAVYNRVVGGCRSNGYDGLLTRAMDGPPKDEA